MQSVSPSIYVDSADFRRIVTMGGWQYLDELRAVRNFRSLC